MRVTAGGLLRTTAIVMVWLTAMFAMAVAVNRSTSNGSSFWLPLIVTAIAIAAAVFLSRVIARARVYIEFGLEPKRVPASTALPRKNSDLSVGDLREMLHLLNENDLDDLRAELREAMRARIRNLTGQPEFESFEHLLAEPEPRQRAKRG
ncbi:MAG: hypothetical protein IPM16_21595 [Chloroflexi bacterium]|nr:hypothetical protein [Chloroflexota bacterium]